MQISFVFFFLQKNVLSEKILGKWIDFEINRFHCKILVNFFLFEKSCTPTLRIVELEFHHEIPRNKPIWNNRFHYKNFVLFFLKLGILPFFKVLNTKLITKIGVNKLVLFWQIFFKLIVRPFFWLLKSNKNSYIISMAKFSGQFLVFAVFFHFFLPNFLKLMYLIFSKILSNSVPLIIKIGKMSIWQNL